MKNILKKILATALILLPLSVSALSVSPWVTGNLTSIYPGPINGVNPIVGVGTTTPDAVVHAKKVFTSGTSATLNISESAAAGCSDFLAGDYAAYQVYSFVDGGSSRIFSDSFITNEHTVINNGFGIYLAWSAVTGASGYVVVAQTANRNGDDDVYWITTLNTLTDTEDCSGDISTYGTPTLTPTSGTVNSRLIYNDGSKLFGVFTDFALKAFGITDSNLTASRAIYADANKQLASSSTTSTELGYVSGVTSAIQTQLNGKVDDVTSTDNAITRFDSTGGAVQNSGLILDDSNNITGPTAGFKITGGTGTTADLNLQTTSGVGASGADMHFLVGSNGGTEAMTILNDGTVGVNTVSPSGSKMVVTPTSSSTRGLTVIRDGSSSTNPSALAVINTAVSAEAGALIENGGPNDFGVLRMHGTRVNTDDFLGAFEFGDKTSVADPRTSMILGYAGTASGRGYMKFLTRDGGGFDTNLTLSEGGGVTLSGGDLTASTRNIITDTTTGTKIGTGTTQKLGFFNATPIVQVPNTTEIGVALSNLGLRAAGTAYPITTSGAVTLGSLTSTRIPIAGTAGLLGDDADMTFTGGDTLNATKLVSSTSVSTPLVISTGVIRLKNYTVATLPAGVQGNTAYVTDALAPTFLAAVVGGGTVVTPVFYNGTNWVGY